MGTFRTALNVLDSLPDLNELCSSPMSESESRTLRAVRNVPRYSFMLKDAQHQDRQHAVDTSLQDVPSVPYVGTAENHSSVLANSGLLSQRDVAMADPTQSSHLQFLARCSLLRRS